MLHGCARTAPRVRAELQASQEPTGALARRYRLNPKTVAERRARTTTADAPMGPRARRSRVLTARQEAIGDVHTDACELRSTAGTAHLFVAVDRVSEFAHVELHRRATMAAGAAFLRSVLAALPYKVRTVLTDDGVPFAAQARYRSGPTETHGGRPFGRVCRAHGVRHKLTEPYHPRTNGQAERMVRTLKEATVRADHDDTHVDLATHLQAFVTARNSARHPKALRWRTPDEAVCAAWAADPHPFKLDPHHLIPGPHT